MSGRKKGHIVSEETRRKISESGKGRIPWNKWKGGYKLGGRPEEVKRKISEKLKGRKLSEDHRKKISNIRKGKKQSEETKKKRSIIMKKYVKKNKPKHLFKKGDIPWNYIDGKSILKRTIGYGDDWDKIRLKIYKRDDYRCQICNLSMNESNKKYNVVLHIHHKIPFRISNDNSLNNLITLCPRCHGKEDTKYRKNEKRRMSR